MFKALLCGTGAMLLAVVAGPAQAQPSQSVAVELANLREDVRGLSQRVNELQLRLEQLEHENGELRAKAAGAAHSYATVGQLNEAVAEMDRSIKAAAAAAKNETLLQVSGQMEKLARQTNAALDSLARAIPSRTPSAPAPQTFSDDYPKEGITYTVQKGDTLAVIAKKTGAKQQDIINANKLADPSKIQVGQALFIPAGKQ